MPPATRQLRQRCHAGSSAGWQLGVPAWERAHRAGRLVRRRTSCIC